MTSHKFPGFLSAAVLLLVLSGCAYPISKELRQEAIGEPTFSMVLQEPAAHRGAVVIWGGIIMKTTNYKDGAEIIVLETPLGFREKPKGRTHSQGRFIARSTKFLDPAVYARGKRITVAGEISGSTIKSIGQFPYVYPVIMAKEIKLWENIRYAPLYYRWENEFYGFYYPLDEFYEPEEDELE